MSADPDQPEVPRVLGAYTLTAKVGEGGMGVVHRAERSHGPDVAIKVLRPHIAHDPEARKRLEREVQTLSRVHHPRVAAVLDADVDGPAPYIVTEFVPGAPLDVVVRQEGPLRPEALVRLGEGLSEALTAIHAQGIVHRDLKPGNVLMVRDDPVVIDFGIAQVADDARLTMTGMVMGTPGYLSPEVVEGGAVTEATDWWGWAATLAFAASGQAPFGTGPMSVVLDRVIRGRYTLAGVDPQLRPLLAAALDPDPGRRPHASEVMNALQLYAQHRPVTEALTFQPRTAPPPQHSQGADPTMSYSPQQAPAPVVDPTLAHRPQQTRVAPAPGGQWQPQAQPQYPQQAPPGHGPPQGGRTDPYSPAPAPGGPSSDPRIGRPPRTGTMAALLAVFVGVCAVAPLLGWGLLVLWSVAARTTDQAVTAMVLRRYEVGARRSDVPVAVALAPWHGLLAVLATTLALLLPVAFAVATTVISAAGLTESGLLIVDFDHPVPLTIGSLLGAIIAWWGPGGMSLRRGSRTIARRLVPAGLPTTLVVAFLASAGIALAAFSFADAGAVSWWPGERAPFADLVPQILRP